MSELEPVVRLLRDLVAIASVNPCFADGTGEREIAEFVANYAQKAGLEVHRIPVEEGRENVLVGLVGQRTETVLWETHMDTVTAQGMTISPFDPKLEDGRLYGRGGGGPTTPTQILEQENNSFRLAVIEAMEEALGKQASVKIRKDNFTALLLAETRPEQLRCGQRERD